MRVLKVLKVMKVMKVKNAERRFGAALIIEGLRHINDLPPEIPDLLHFSSFIFFLSSVVRSFEAKANKVCKKNAVRLHSGF